MRTIETCKRDKMIWLAKAAGSSYPEIAARLGISPTRTKQLALRWESIAQRLGCDPRNLTPEQAAEMKLLPSNSCGPDAPDDALLDRFGLSPYALNALKRAGFATAGDVRRVGDEELLRIKDLGEKSLADIKAKLGKPGDAPTRWQALRGELKIQRGRPRTACSGSHSGVQCGPAK